MVAADRTEYDHPHSTQVGGELVYGDDAAPGYRGMCDDEMRYWNPRAPPCVPSDLRPHGIFRSHAAANAVGKAARVEMFMMPADYDEVRDNYSYDEELDEIARLEYKYAMRQLLDQGLCPDPCPMFGVRSCVATSHPAMPVRPRSSRTVAVGGPDGNTGLLWLQDGRVGARMLAW